jgi:hypothetical protein
MVSEQKMQDFDMGYSNIGPHAHSYHTMLSFLNFAVG